MAVLTREIRAKLESASRTAAQSVVSNIVPVQSDAGIAPSTTLPSAVPTSHNGHSQSPATIDLGISPDSVVSQESGSAVTVAAPIASAAVSSSEYYILKRELKDWLKPVSFKADMDAYRRQYVPGTREWAVDAIGKQFAGDANVVWLNGAAGVGKSLVAYLAARSPLSGFSLLSAFFCKHYDEKKNNAKQLVCRLVYDLACASPAAGLQIQSLMQKDKDYCTQNPTALSILDKPIVAFSTLFLELLPLLGTSGDPKLLPDSSVSAASPHAPATRFLIVIDALDECGTQGDPTRNELLSVLASLNTPSSTGAAKLPPFVKILTTGRPEAEIWK
ncbi:hypothetical protein HDU84_001390, partial [Entophlyctis sp. JEL0112]